MLTSHHLSAELLLPNQNVKNVSVGKSVEKSFALIMQKSVLRVPYWILLSKIG